MKKTAKSRRKPSEDMQPEYEFDYTNAKSNRFAGRIALHKKSAQASKKGSGPGLTTAKRLN